MNNVSESILTKFSNTPGLCSINELNKVKEFIEHYVKIRDLYKKSFGN